VSRRGLIRNSKLRCDGPSKFPAPCSRCASHNLQCKVDPTFKRTPAKQYELPIVVQAMPSDLLGLICATTLLLLSYQIPKDLSKLLTLDITNRGKKTVRAGIQAAGIHAGEARAQAGALAVLY
jgi:hypothetical protein